MNHDHDKDSNRSGRHVRPRTRDSLLRAGLALALGLPAVSPLALASERDLDAHEHGAATLDIALDGDRLYIDLEGPADNVLGFEHAPSTDEQRESVDEAERLLGAADLFAPSAAAGCTFEEATVNIALPDPDEGHGDEHGDEDAHGDEHAHDDEHGDEHGDEDAHGDEHGDEHGHGDEHAEAGAVHSDMEASHVFVCENPAALDQVATALFERFDGFVDIDVQLVGPGGQDGAELTANDANVSLEAIR